MSREKVLCGKEEVVRVAIDIVDRDGIGALSVRNIAKELTVSPMTIYNYVENLKEIKRRVLVSGFDRMYAVVLGMLKAFPSPITRLDFCRTIAMGVYEFSVDNRGVFLFMFSEGQCLFSEDAEIKPFYNFVAKLMKRSKVTQQDWAINEMGYKLLEMLILSVTYQSAAGGHPLTKEEYADLIDYYLERCIM